MSEVIDLDLELVYHLADPEAVAVLLDQKLSPELVVDDRCREVYEWQVEHVHEHGQPATQLVLEDEFPWLRDDFYDPETAIDDLLDRIRSRYVRNMAGPALVRIATKVKTDPLAAIHDLSTVARELKELATSRDETFGTGDHERSMRVYEETMTQGPGPTLGFPELDVAYNGIRALVFLVAPPKTGKSWIGINSAYEQIMQGKRPYLDSLEMPAVETDWRLKCRAANVPFWKFIKGKLSHEDLDLLAAAASILDESGAYEIAKPAPGKRDANHLVDAAMNWGADSLIVDQLQYVETPGGRSIGTKNETGDYWEACNTFKDNSDHLPMLIIHQFNRSVMNADAMPEIQQIKGSSAIEETGTLILGAWANKEMKKSGMIELGSMAARNFSDSAWEIRLELNRGCDFSVVGEVEDD